MASQKELIDALRTSIEGFGVRYDRLDERVEELLSNHMPHFQGELSRVEVRLTERLASVEGKLVMLGKVVWSVLVVIVLSVIVNLISG